MLQADVHRWDNLEAHSSCFFRGPQRYWAAVALSSNQLGSTPIFGFMPCHVSLFPLRHRYHFLGSNSNKPLTPKTSSQALLLGDPNQDRKSVLDVPSCFIFFIGNICCQMQFAALDQDGFQLHILLSLVIPQLWALPNFFHTLQKFLYLVFVEFL